MTFRSGIWQEGKLFKWVNSTTTDINSLWPIKPEYFDEKLKIIKEKFNLDEDNQLVKFL